MLPAVITAASHRGGRSARPVCGWTFSVTAAMGLRSASRCHCRSSASEAGAAGGWTLAPVMIARLRRQPSTSARCRTARWRPRRRPLPLRCAKASARHRLYEAVIRRRAPPPRGSIARLPDVACARPLKRHCSPPPRRVAMRKSSAAIGALFLLRVAQPPWPGDGEGRPQPYWRRQWQAASAARPLGVENEPRKSLMSRRAAAAAGSDPVQLRPLRVRCAEDRRTAAVRLRGIDAFRPSVALNVPISGSFGKSGRLINPAS